MGNTETTPVETTPVETVPAETETTTVASTEEVKPVEEIKPVETVEDAGLKEAKVDIERLKVELISATEKAREVETLTASVETIRTDLELKAGQIAEYEALLSTMVATKMDKVPAEYLDLIPTNMDIKQKLDWLNKAEAKGLFNKEVVTNPNVEIGKPMNVEPPAIDTSKMSTRDLLRMAYAK